MRNKLSIILFLGIFLMTLVVAETELYKVSDESNLQFDCTINNGVPSTSATFNLSIYYPNGTDFINNVQASSQGQGSFNYTTTFPEVGLYKVKMFCYDSIHNFSDSGFYDVTPIGKELTIAKVISYVLIFIFSILLFIGLLVMGFGLKGENDRSMTGYIIEVSNIKYLKLTLIGFAYLILLFINYFGWMISFAYLDMTFVTNIFRFVFTFQVALTLPLFILFTYLTITNLMRDSKIKDALTSGIRIK